MKEAAEITPLKKKYNPVHYRYFPELSAWAFFLKEKTLVLKREAAGFDEIQAGNTSESALAMLSNAGKKHTIRIFQARNCG